jgi:hypothetical protein
MNNLFHVAAASGGEVFIGLVVAVIAIIVQIVKSRAEQAPKQQSSSPGSDDPGEELRKFLESLGGETTEPSRPPPPPPPPVQSPPAPRVTATQPKPRMVEHERGVERRNAQVAPAFAPAPPDAYVRAASWESAREPERVAVSLGSEIGDEESRRREVKRQAAHKAFRMSLLADLRGRDSKPIQKAIVLSELLGTPVGFRRAEQAPGAVRY